MNKNSNSNDSLRTNNPTRRVISSDLEEIIYKPIRILDHGFIRVIDYMGNDSSIVQAARVSYGQGTKKRLEDKGLINYLMRHNHSTPFEMCDIKLHIKLPIFVARQWIRHRTASVNEYSARYSILSNEFYIPQKNNLSVQLKDNKQGRGNTKLADDVADNVLEVIKDDSERCHTNYRKLINEDEQGNVIDKEKPGISREIARINLTLNHYTEWYWKINLHNLLHFLSLRVDKHAQYEIRVYAKAILDVVKVWVPNTHDAFLEYHMNGTNISNKGMEVIRQIINGKEVNQKSSGLSNREWMELMQVIEQPYSSNK